MICVETTRKAGSLHTPKSEAAGAGRHTQQQASCHDAESQESCKWKGMHMCKARLSKGRQESRKLPEENFYGTSDNFHGFITNT